MTKSMHRARRRPAKSLQPTSRHAGAGKPSDSLTGQGHPIQPPLLDRILDAPHLPYIVPRLQPGVLHKIIERCGLEDCGELVALATPEQLRRVFDLDLWRSGRPGFDEQLDADRFGVWLEVLMESGATVAAQKLTAMDPDVVIAALAQHLLVFDRSAVSAYTTLDGVDVPASRGPSDKLDCEIGNYLVEATRTDSWDAIVAVLLALDAGDPDYFARLMSGCRSLSSSVPEIDGCDTLLIDREQDMFDLAFDREQRREQQGYVAPDQARAFLQMARQLHLGQAAAPPRNPIAGAYFRALDWTAPADASHESRHLLAASSSPDPTNDADAFAALVDVLVEAGVMPPPPRALLDTPQGDAPRLARIQTQMRFAYERDQSAYSTRSQELAYLANTIVAGCSIQARPFTPQEATDAVVAVCNLGLENWPVRWLPDGATGTASAVGAGATLPDDFLVTHDLIAVFQVGWSVLHADVTMSAAERLIEVLTGLSNDDPQIRAGLKALRIAITKHWRDGAPWRARDDLDVLVSLDMPAWAALLGLLDECPVVHAAVRATRRAGIHSVSASDFEFISENEQIAAVRRFMESLPNILGAEPQPRVPTKPRPKGSRREAT